MVDQNPLASNVAALLGRFGVTVDASSRVSAETVAEQFLVSRGHADARVAELRWETMVIACPSHTAALLRYDLDLLHAELNRQVPGVVHEIRLRVTAPA